MANPNRGVEGGGSVASSVSYTVYTPTYTTDVDVSTTHVPFSVDGGVGTFPEDGGMYMIKDLDSGRALVLEGGRLTLGRDVGTNGGWRWQCVERDDGWLGFREAVSHNYLGRDGKGGFQAKVGHFKAWEAFCLRPLSDGGCHLMAINWWTLKRLGIAGNDTKLVEVSSATEATRWEFIEVGS
ncbi:hypothetical protein AAE478_004005 [Parahypoxylon ruwenzoriense]